MNESTNRKSNKRQPLYIILVHNKIICYQNKLCKERYYVFLILDKPKLHVINLSRLDKEYEYVSRY